MGFSSFSSNGLARAFSVTETRLRNAKELKEAGKYKNALSQLAKARDLGVAEALNQIRDLEKEIKSLKEANNPIKRLTDLFGRILEE